MRWIWVALLCIGCTPPSPQDSDTMVLWHAYRGAEAEALESAVSRFTKMHGGHVRLVSIPYDAFSNKIRVAVPRGNGPDLFIFAHDRIGDWAASGLLEPIGLWADGAMIDPFFPRTVDALVYRGDLYGLPLAFKTLALFYDTSLVPTVPQTTDALITQAKAARKDPDVWGIAYELDSLYFHAPWLHGFGGKVYQDQTDTIALGEPAAASSVAFVRRLVTEGIVPDEVTSALVTSLFRAHKLAFTISGPWFRSELSGHQDWAVAPLPVVSETGLRAKPFLGVEALLMSARAKDKARAFALMRFLTSDAEARIRVDTQLVANHAVLGDPKVSADPFVAAFVAQVEHTVPLSNRPHMRRVWTPMKAALSQGIVQGRAPAEALAEAVRAIAEGDK